MEALELVKKIRRNLNLLFQIIEPREYRRRTECFWKGYRISDILDRVISLVDENKWDEAITIADALLDYIPYGCGTDLAVSKIEEKILELIEAVKERDVDMFYREIKRLEEVIEDFYISLGGIVPKMSTH